MSNEHNDTQDNGDESHAQSSFEINQVFSE